MSQDSQYIAAAACQVLSSTPAMTVVMNSTSTTNIKQAAQPLPRNRRPYLLIYSFKRKTAFDDFLF